jgi:hypothetical protein
LRLTWTPQAELLGAPGEPTVFIHLWNRSGDLLRTFDHPLPKPWQVGGEISYDLELYQSVLAAPLPPGDYDLSAGLYTADGRRWPLTVKGREMKRQEYLLTTLTVPPVSAETPTFTFPTGWADPVEGRDLQVPVLRWMAGEAAVQVGNLGVPGSLWLRLNLPDGEGPWQQRFVGDTEKKPRLEVRAECSDEFEELDTLGIHEVVLPIYGEGGDASCRLHFQANYALVHSDTGEERTAALEVLAWSPAVL